MVGQILDVIEGVVVDDDDVVVVLEVAGVDEDGVTLKGVEGGEKLSAMSEANCEKG